MSTAVFLGLFFTLLLLRCPIAYAMLVASAIYLTTTPLPELQLTLKTANGVDKFTLLAVPMFLLAGNLMNSMGVTQRIFRFAGVLVRHIPGGLGHVNVVASVIFAGMSGSAVADAGGLGAVEIRAMREARYSDRLSAAITAASATIGPVIPPSITMVIFAYLADESVGRLFLAGAVPGLIMALSLMVIIYLIAKTGRETLPPLPRAGLRETWEAFRGAVLPMLAPVILIAGILGGVFTPTEASVVVVLYVLAIGVVTLNFDARQIGRALLQTVRTTAATQFIIAVSAIFGWIITIEQVPMQVVSVLAANIGSQTEALLFIVLILLIVGMFMEVIAALILLTPTLLMIASAFAIDPVHLGVVTVVTMMIGTITPPVGLVLYTVMAVARIPMQRLVMGLLPFYAALLIAALIVALVPQTALWLPTLLMG